MLTAACGGGMPRRHAAAEGRRGMKEQTGIALISAPPEDADRIARQLVTQRLAACAQVSTVVTSVYWWREELQEDQERLIILKTSAGSIEPIRRLLERIHPYELPELIFLPSGGGDPEYLRWITASLGPDD
jgi:periplasmic divalent cation tolerance protein